MYKATLKHQSIAVFGCVLSILGTAELAGAIVTTNNPELHRVAPGDFSGVVKITSVSGLYSYNCTGSLLKDGLHVLTAAHCLTDDKGKFQTSFVNKTNATFNLSTGSVSVPVTDYFLHPGYDASYNNDIAVLRLGTSAPSQAQRYDIYRNKDEVGKTFTQVGYGYAATGDTGYDSKSSFGIAHFGQNRFDGLIDLFEAAFKKTDSSGVVLGTQLVSDFDNGQAANDGFGTYFGINDLGVGVSETNSAEGDSGGPAFIDNLIAGVTSYGLSYSNGKNRTDVDTKNNNSSFGEFSTKTRVSYYTQFIDDVIAGKISSAATATSQPQSAKKGLSLNSSNIKTQQGLQETRTTIPEPSSLLGMLLLSASICFLKKGQKLLARTNT